MSRKTKKEKLARERERAKAAAIERANRKNQEQPRCFNHPLTGKIHSQVFLKAGLAVTMEDEEFHVEKIDKSTPARGKSRKKKSQEQVAKDRFFIYLFILTMSGVVGVASIFAIHSGSLYFWKLWKP